MKCLLLTTVVASILLAGCVSTSPGPRSNTRQVRPEHPVAYVEELLKAYPGVYVRRHGTSFEIRIRGSHREPLYIVDGLPLTSQPPHTLLGINPYDIERIEVLTDPVDLAVYGHARTSSGVVLITTKRGR